jgi:hypothetical protein
MFGNLLNSLKPGVMTHQGCVCCSQQLRSCSPLLLQVHQHCRCAHAGLLQAWQWHWQWLLAGNTEVPATIQCHIHIRSGDRAVNQVHKQHGCGACKGCLAATQECLQGHHLSPEQSAYTLLGPLYST